MENIHQILRKYWGYEKFRPLQEDIIRSVLDGKDTLALLPTGGGKSICFQVPAMVMDGLCLVITPLIALMKDQVEQLKRRGVSAIAVYSGMKNREIDVALDNCIYGQVKFLYLSPERLHTELFKVRAKKMKVSLIAVDEAHCISQWGYDFRPAYLEIASLRDMFPKVPVLALTASATPEVQKDIVQHLNFGNYQVFEKSFARSNLSYSCFYEENKYKKLLEILNNVKGTAIVYLRSRKKTEEVARFLRKYRVSADFYHAGLDAIQRAAKQDAWMKGITRVIVATNAFGMGIDKGDVRVVVHLDLPDNPESYYQEAGRAGRDEKKAYAVILYDNTDIEELEKKILMAYPSPDMIRKVYQGLANYYKIAVGTSYLNPFDFDQEEFCKVYGLSKIDVYYSLKRLEEEGLIQLSDAFYQPSKIHIIVDNKKLYEFQVANEKLDRLIKGILRMYGGEAFSNYITISEKEIARNLNMQPGEVVSQLAYLDKLEIISYSKQAEHPQLIFTTARYDAALLPIDVKTLERRKNNNLQKAKAVIEYVANKEECRSLLLQRYFGEKAKEPCGICDVCIHRKREGENREVIKSMILQKLLEYSSLTIQKLVELIGANKEKEILSEIREMIDCGEVLLKDDDRLTLS